MLTVVERDRIYAITSKNRIITSFFCLIMISQFIGGLYLTVYVAVSGGGSVTKCHLRFLPTTLQRDQSSRSRFRFLWYAFSRGVGAWKS